MQTICSDAEMALHKQHHPCAAPDLLDNALSPADIDAAVKRLPVGGAIVTGDQARKIEPLLGPSVLAALIFPQVSSKF